MIRINWMVLKVSEYEIFNTSVPSIEPRNENIIIYLHNIIYSRWLKITIYVRNNLLLNFNYQTVKYLFFMENILLFTIKNLNLMYFGW